MLHIHWIVHDKGFFLSFFEIENVRGSVNKHMEFL
jgi:hypothetical protein